jgi:Tfp pilus assembly protein PilP
MRHVPLSVLAVLSALSLVSAPAIAGERRDPFVSVLSEEPIDEGERTALERVKLEELTLTGLVVGTATPKAMFQTPDGRGHFARIGDGVGKNRARVVRISSTGVTLVDEWRDAIGGLHRNVIEIAAPALRRPL